MKLSIVSLRAACQHPGTMQKYILKRVCMAGATAIALCGGVMLMTGCRTAMVIVAISSGVAAVAVIAKYKASAEQKAAAEQQMRSLHAAVAAKSGATPGSAKVKSHATAKVAPTTHGAARKTVGSAAASAANPDAAATEKLPPPQTDVPGAPARPIPSTDELEDSAARLLPPYIAVPVPPQGIPAEKRGKATYMLWDTHKQQLATDDVYVLKKEVQEGKLVKLNGVKAQVAKAP